VLWEEGHLALDAQARFHTRSGVLLAERRGEWIEVDMPAKLEQAAEPPAELAEALGLKPVYVGRNQFDYLVEVESAEALRGANPDHGVLRKLPVRGVIVTARSDSPDYDFISRFFAPGSGIDEDPVTGSAHCCLGPYWSKRLGKTEFLAYQASPRGGVVRVRCSGDRVYLGGQAVTVLRGELMA
jgi:PhzF family phenazine biosynthesis protein